MLIINILLILLFFIILFYNKNIIEGQGYDLYNYSYFLIDYDTILNKINLSDYLGFDIKNYMKKYNNHCKDTNEDLVPNEIYNVIKNNSNINMETDIINVESKLNNILGYFNIQIENEDELSINNDDNNNDDNNNDDNVDNNIPKVCSLVNIIYNKNNNMPDSLINDITTNYGNCFTSEGDSDTFRETCKKSCHLQEENLEICHEFGADNISNCSEFSEIPSHQNNRIHIKKKWFIL